MLLGVTGAGKTLLTRRIVANADRLIVIDPHGEWSGNFLAVFSWDEFYQAAKREKFRIAVRVEDDPEVLIDRVFRAAYLVENCHVVVEEAFMWFPRAGKVPTSIEVFNRFGRRRNVSAYFLAQRSVDIPPNIRGMCTDVFAFRLVDQIDRENLAKRIGHREMRDKVARLPDRHYYHFDLRRYSEPTLHVVPIPGQEETE